MFGRDKNREPHSLHNMIVEDQQNIHAFIQASHDPHLLGGGLGFKAIKASSQHIEAENPQLHQEREDKAEDNRQFIYDAHIKLIDDGMTLSFLELEKRINNLSSLEEPIKHSQQILNRGLPLKNEFTLFDVILKNSTLSSTQKFYLYEKLLEEKGYCSDYRTLLTSPTIDLILSNINHTTLLLQLFYKFNQLSLLREELIKASLISWPALIAAHQQAGLDSTVLTECFEHWISLTQLKDALTFVNTYIQFLAANPNLKFNVNIWNRVFVENEVEGNHLYLEFKNLQNTNGRFAISENCMLALSVWVNAYNPPHDFTSPKNHYYDLVRSNKFTRVLENEETVWIKLLQSHDVGTEIFEALVNHFASPQKLLKFIETWVNALDNDDAIRNAFLSLEPHLNETSIQSYKDEIKNIIGLRLQTLLVEKKAIANDKANLKWLKKTRPTCSFFTCCFSTKDGYNVYNLIRQNKSGAEAALREEKHDIEEKINDKLIKNHQQEKFEFRRN